MRAAVVAAPSEFALGVRSPHRIERPTSIDDLSRTLRDNDARGDAVVLFGGGSMQALGFAPERYDAAIDVRGLDRVVAYEPRDLTIGIEAGATVEDLNRTLAGDGQFVPLDAPRASFATVGGTLAAGWLGPRRAAYGRPRDFVIGSTAVLADGTIARAGGMVVKNVTGYDMSRLYIGSFGTLVALGQINLKTLPMPAHTSMLAGALPAGTRGDAFAALRSCEIEPTAALVIAGYTGEIAGDDAADGRLLVLFEGSAALVGRGCAECTRALGTANVSLRSADADPMALLQQAIDASIAPRSPHTSIYRMAGGPSDLAERCARSASVAARLGYDLETICDARTGDLIARFEPRSNADEDAAFLALDDAAQGMAARVKVLHAPAVVRDRVLMWGAPPPSLPTMRDLKSRFDPKRTLAPGRFIERL